MTREISATATALAATLGGAAAAWVIAIRQMSGMDMGIATPLGSFWSFAGLWLAMMAAMMLPGAAPAAVRRAHDAGGARTVPLFVGSYLLVWALAGLAVYALDRPHGTGLAAAVAIAAGIYELTPIKQSFRRRCRERAGNGFQFGLDCVGSSSGLMLVMVAVGLMSIAWMAAFAAVIVAQKVVPANVALDVPLALALVGFGLLILVTPSAVPGLVPAMPPMPSM